MEVHLRGTAIREQRAGQVMLNVIECQVIAHVGVESAHMHHTQWGAVSVCILPALNPAANNAVDDLFPTRSRNPRTISFDLSREASRAAVRTDGRHRGGSTSFGARTG